MRIINALRMYVKEKNTNLIRCDSVCVNVHVNFAPPFCISIHFYVINFIIKLSIYHKHCLLVFRLVFFGGGLIMQSFFAVLT